MLLKIFCCVDCVDWVLDHAVHPNCMNACLYAVRNWKDKIKKFISQLNKLLLLILLNYAYYCFTHFERQKTRERCIFSFEKCRSRQRWMDRVSIYWVIFELLCTVFCEHSFPCFDIPIRGFMANKIHDSMNLIIHYFRGPGDGGVDVKGRL